MQRVDIVIALLAVVALGGSILGVALYEAPDPSDWELGFPLQEGSADDVAVITLGDSASGDDTWTLNEMNITSVTFTITVTGAGPRLEDLVVEVAITSPGGTSEPERFTLPGPSQEESTVEDTISFTLDARPESRVVSAANETEALADLPMGMNGTGDWEIHAEIVSGAGAVLPETVTVDVTAEYAYWRVQVADSSPDLSPAA